EQATPPAFTAWAGPKRMPFSKNASIASLVQGIVAPSATTFTLLLINFSAASLSISFCVAQGSAISQGTDQVFEQSRSEEHTSELQSRFDLVCRLLLEKKKKNNDQNR